MPTKRTCAGTNRAGNPCKAAPLTGQQHCIAHSDKETQESTGFGGSQPGAGRPKNPRAVDLLRERIEQDIDTVLDPLWEALDATSGVVVGNGPGATVEFVADYRTRIAAVKELLDRAYGKSKQQTEITGPEGGPVILEAPQDARERSRRAAALLAERGLVGND